MRFRLALIAGMIGLAATPAATAPVTSARVRPASVTHPDFVRNARRSNWTGLTVRRQTVVDGGVTWKLWRIANRRRPRGPLWVVPHDNENAAFAAGLRAVKRWGGTLVAVDSGGDDTSRAARYVYTRDGRRIDPNRSFTSDFPGYVRVVLAKRRARQPIIGLHTNAAGFDADASLCAGDQGPRGGSGDISIRICNDTYSPRPARRRIWPWDDDDSIIIAPYLAAAKPGAGWCQRQLKRGNVNVSFERVGEGDGSLSNYAAKRGLAYLNFETRDRGSDPAGLAAARRRMTAMINTVMRRCPPVRPRLPAPRRGGKKAR